MPTTSVAVSKCPNQRLTESEPLDAVCTAFIEKNSGACMHGTRTGADPLLLGGVKWLPWGLPFAGC